MSCLSAQNWCKVLEQLKVLCQSDGHANAAAKEVLALLDERQDAHASPASWKDIVNMKVPLHAATACAKMVTDPAQQRVLPTWASLAALNQLLDDAAAANVSPATAPPARIMAGLTKQLEQSGFMKHYPALLAAAAQALQQQDACLSSSISSSHHAGNSSSSGSRRMLREHADRLLHMHRVLYMLWPGAQQLTVFAGSAASVIQLVYALLQDVSREVQRLQASSPDALRDLEQPLRSAQSSATALCMYLFTVEGVVDGLEPGVQPLLLSQQFMPCMAFVWATYIFALRMKGTRDLLQTAAAQSGSTGGNSSSRNSGSGAVCPGVSDKKPRDAVKAWQEGFKWLPKITACQHKLFEVAGFDARTALWAAALAKPICYIEGASMATRCYMRALALRQQKGFRLGMGVSALTEATFQQLRMERQLMELLPALLLTFPAGLPADHELFLDACPGPVDASRMSLLVWQDMCSFLDMCEGAAQDQCKQHHPSAAVLNEVLPLACKLTARIVQRPPAATAWDRQHSSSAPGSGSSGGGSSSSGSSGNGRGGSMLTQPVLIGFVTVVDTLLKRAVWHRPAALGTAAEESAAAPAGDDSNEPQHMELLCVQGLTQHTSAILSCFEGFTRYVTSRAAPALDSITQQALLDITYVTRGRLGPLVVLACAAGAGSREQQQLFSLLCTYAKASHCVTAGQSAGMCIGNAANASQALVSDTVQNSLQQASATAAASGTLTAAGRTATAESGSGMEGVSSLGIIPVMPSFENCDPVSMLPCLSHFGRCCLMWAQQLQQDAPELLRAAAKGQHTVQEHVAVAIEAWTWARSMLRGPYTGVPTLGPMTAAGICFSSLNENCLLDFNCSTYMAWLDTHSVAQQLSARGYEPQRIWELLCRLRRARNEAAECPVAEAAAKMAVLVQQLLETGLAGSALAVTVFCNNPACRNLSGGSEQLLVSGRSCQCAGCLTARYCGRACQKAHWKQHKPVCKALAAAMPVPAAT